MLLFHNIKNFTFFKRVLIIIDLSGRIVCSYLFLFRALQILKNVIIYYFRL